MHSNTIRQAWVGLLSGGAAVGLMSARPCTGTTLYWCAVSAKDILLTGSWLKHSDWLRLRLMDQSQEIILGHSVFPSREYGYHGYRHTAVRLAIKIIPVLQSSSTQLPLSNASKPTAIRCMALYWTLHWQMCVCMFGFLQKTTKTFLFTKSFPEL